MILTIGQVKEESFKMCSQLSANNMLLKSLTFIDFSHMLLTWINDAKVQELLD